MTVTTPSWHPDLLTTSATSFVMSRTTMLRPDGTESASKCVTGCKARRAESLEVCLCNLGAKASPRLA
eukprot:CAMPEP_0173240810 /NCGR_PEP_ID=MMETSP1142-20121109/13997_1 /TAXON_ID=483371 /ORGANISM="non described non described, Strain CCMP2298" /LENGTH=67 /DNA_ID=CAMNT_0014172021 /DNA_START=380 /DNA_END=579 /DNA_ORIENTATION=-